MDITPYTHSAYRDGGRGEIIDGARQYDCWGLVRAVRHEALGFPLLPSYGHIRAADKYGLTNACRTESKAFRPGAPQPGAIATVWRGRACTHVAVCCEVDGRLGVLEMRINRGCQWLSVRKFEQTYLKVVYYS